MLPSEREVEVRWISYGITYPILTETNMLHMSEWHTVLGQLVISPYGSELSFGTH